MPDIKKLITGFLIIAAATSSSALILSNIRSGQNNTSALNEAASDTPALAIADQNAFIPSEQDVTGAINDQNPGVAVALNDPGNITTNFTDAFLNGVSTSNPTGISTDTVGNAIIQTPTAQQVASALKTSPALKSFQLPNWDAQAAQESLNISPSANVSAYNDALNGVLNQNFAQSGVENLVGQQNLDPSVVQTLQTPLSSALSQASAIPTPANLVNFQKSLVKLLVYENNMVALASEAQTDPVKASLVFQAEQNKYTQVVQAFGVESQKATSAGLLSLGTAPQNENKTLAMLETYLGVPTAHAQWITFSPQEFADWLLDTINNLILQIIKNTLVAFIQQRVLSWIQGSGAPKFVQQFGNQLVQVAQAKAISSLANVLPGYNASCPNIGKLLSQTTANLNLAVPTKNTPICSLQPVSVSQITNFYKNFNISANVVPGGSWGLYAQVLSPGGNYYGSILQTMDYVNGQTSQATQAKTTQTVANQGFIGTMQCDDGSNPNGTSTQCDDGNGGYTQATYQDVCPDGTPPQNITTCPGGATPTAQANCNQYANATLDASTGMCDLADGTTAPAVVSDVCAGGAAPTTVNGCEVQGVGVVSPKSQLSCPSGNAPEVYNNNGECADGSEPYTTTPGQTTKTVHDQALGGALELTVNANSITGVLASVATSLLNTIVQAGITQASKLATQRLTSVVLSATAGTPSSVGGSTPPPPTPPTNLPQTPPTKCQPENPQCTSGAAGQCTSGYLGEKITFSASGGDGLTYSWSASAPSGVAVVPSSGSGPTFDPYFTVANAASTTFPITVPITVRGSDNATDTCLAVITQ